MTNIIYSTDKITQIQYKNLKHIFKFSDNFVIYKLPFQVKLHVKCLLTTMQKTKAEQLILMDPEANCVVD